MDQTNHWLSQRIPPFALAVGMLLLSWSTYLVYYHLWFGLNGPPAASGDEPDYDSLGWELSRGRGYRIDTGNEAFRRPYDLAAKENPLYELGEPRSGVVTYRPPLFPAVVAGIDFFLGRQFWGIRLFNAFCMATICGLLTWYVTRWKGVFWFRCCSLSTPWQPPAYGGWFPMPQFGPAPPQIQPSRAAIRHSAFSASSGASSALPLTPIQSASQDVVRSPFSVLVSGNLKSGRVRYSSYWVCFASRFEVYQA